MTKVTSKRQVTIPKAVADRYGIGAGDEILFEPAGEVIRVVPPGGVRPALDVEERLKLFDRATQRQDERQERRKSGSVAGSPGDRGWRREDLYSRGPD